MILFEPATAERASFDGHAASSRLSHPQPFELVTRGRGGEPRGTQALLKRCVARLERWAQVRLPATVRWQLDTAELADGAALHELRNLKMFEPRHDRAMQVLLRQSIVNQICDEVRRLYRRPIRAELPGEQVPESSPEEAAIRAEEHEDYRQALSRMTPEDRALIVARIETRWTHTDIANRCDLPSADAARMAVNRAVRRLTAELAARRQSQARCG